MACYFMFEQGAGIMSKVVARVMLAVALTAMSPQSVSAKSRDQLLDSQIQSGMSSTGTKGIAVAIIDRGKVSSVKSWGARNAKGDPLTPDTIMYAASLTKAMFAYTVRQMADEGKIDLDASIATYLPKPLPEYADDEDKYSAWHHLAGDERWRKITPRVLLTHSAGFHNFYWLEADEKLKIHFDPGTRYSYSGDGIILLQFVLERGLGLDVGEEMKRRVFDPLGMTNSSMVWRADFARNLADGWKMDGTAEPHDERSETRAAGSLDTSISDFTKFAAAYVRGDGLSKEGRRDLTAAQLPITTLSQFPPLQSDAPGDSQFANLAAGLGVVTFVGPQGRGFFKGGHNDSTGNMWVCVERQKRCVVIMANDVRAEAMFPAIVKTVLGETGMPWAWEYGVQDWTKG
jgi:CubicO group peptidase (beta-lactamase class C family)